MIKDRTQGGSWMIPRNPRVEGEEGRFFDDLEQQEEGGVKSRPQPPPPHRALRFSKNRHYLLYCSTGDGPTTRPGYENMAAALFSCTGITQLVLQQYTTVAQRWGIHCAYHP